MRSLSKEAGRQQGACAAHSLTAPSRGQQRALTQYTRAGEYIHLSVGGVPSEMGRVVCLHRGTFLHERLQSFPCDPPSLCSGGRDSVSPSEVPPLLCVAVPGLNRNAIDCSIRIRFS